MYIGIDVGGTYTDAVVISGNKLVAMAKTPTDSSHLVDSVTTVLDEVLANVDSTHIKRLTLSTTVVTNQVIQGKEEDTELYLIPGPGVNISDLFPVTPHILNGYTNHQGKCIEPFDKGDLSQRGGKKAAVSAKFSVRNPQEELRLRDLLLHNGYRTVSCGSLLSGDLNFIRRTNSAYFNSAVTDGFANFRTAIENALTQRGLDIPVYVLKADGGALPLAVMSERTVETIFTGPAASVLGMEALQTVPEEDTVAVDIGGTTTDLSLWRGRQALLSRSGVAIKNYPTAVRAFQIKSIGIGGDSAISLTENGQLLVGPQRQGPGMAIGGSVPTLGDALIVLGLADYGDKEKAKAAMHEVKNTQTAEETASQVLAAALATIEASLTEALAEENKRPVYEVKDIVNPNPLVPKRLVAVGGTAPYLGEALAKRLGIPVHIPKAAIVANAVGAALAKSTFELTVRVDTFAKTMVIPELGIMEKGVTVQTTAETIEIGKSYLLAEAKKFAPQEDFDVEIIKAEQFPVIHGWQGRSYLITVQIQLRTGVRAYVE